MTVSQGGRLKIMIVMYDGLYRLWKENDKLIGKQSTVPSHDYLELNEVLNMMGRRILVAALTWVMLGGRSMINEKMISSRKDMSSQCGRSNRRG
jgi:hypothetical protein